MAETLSLHGNIARKAMLNLADQFPQLPFHSFCVLLPSFEVHRTSPQTFLSFFFPTFLQEFQPRKIICSLPQLAQLFSLCIPALCGTPLKLSPSEAEVKN